MAGRHVRIRTARGAHRAQRFLDALFSVGALEEDSSLEVDTPQSTSPVWGRSALVIPGAPRLGITPTPPKSARAHVNGGRSGILVEVAQA